MDFTGSNRDEAQRWLTIAEKLLAARDLFGTKSFAFRARESDPIVLEAADRVIAVADTLIAGESRINNQHDWYAILQVPRPTLSIERIASSYRRLAVLLNPDKNRVAFADQTFKLVSDAWSVLSNPSKKEIYDNEFNLQSMPEWGVSGSSQTQKRQQSGQNQQQQQQAVRRSPRTKDGKTTVEEEHRPNININNATEAIRTTRQQHSESTRTSRQEHTESTLPAQEADSVQSVLNRPTEHGSGSFWTACPYCYILYEYPTVYEECVLRCQSCSRAFHAVMIPSPPVSQKDKYFCCWGFFPLGFSGNGKETSANWSPVSSMFTVPLQGQGQAKGKNASASRKSAPRFFYADDDVYVEVSDPSESSDEEWESERRIVKKAKKGLGNRNEKRAQFERGKKRNQTNLGENNVVGGENLNGGFVASGLSNASKGESSKKVAATSRMKKHKGKGASELGKLDLNVEFSNEVEEPPLGVSQGNGTAGHGVEDNIEGMFFDGLDEFLSSLPILNAVTDDKVKAS